MSVNNGIVLLLHFAITLNAIASGLEPIFNSLALHGRS